MTQQDQDIFFSILRAAIWETEPDLFIPDGYDWQPLIDAFTDHALLGVVSHTLMSLPTTKRPSMQQSVSIFNHVGNLTRLHYMLEERIKTIFNLLEEHSIHPILLKGEGLAQLYPKTCVRTCGDIDIYVGQEKYEQAKAIIHTLTTPECIDAATEDLHQYHIELADSIIVELHPIAGCCALKNHQDYYIEWAKNNLEHKPSWNINLNDSTIALPNATFYLPYLFDHLCRHFRFEGVGLRQYVDVVILLRHIQMHHLDVNFSIDIFCQQLKSLGLLRAWQVLGGIFVYQLGYPKEKYPFFNAKHAAKSQKEILEVTLNDGNFGHQSKWRIHPSYIQQTSPIERYRILFNIASLENIMFPFQYSYGRVIWRALTYPVRKIKELSENT